MTRPAPAIGDRATRVARIRAEGLPMCRDHNLSWVVGRWTEFETDDIGLKVTGRLDANEAGKKAAICLRQGTYRGLSLGKAQCHAVQNESGVWVLEHVWAKEITLARNPRDERAVILSTGTD